MLRINPFVICDVVEQARYRQLARYDEWRAKLAALGVSAEQTSTYDTLARELAPTTVYPNADVIAYLRQLAMDALLRGEPMPTTPEIAIDNDSERRMAQAREGAQDLKARFGRRTR